MLYWRNKTQYKVYITDNAKDMLQRHILFLNRVSKNSSIKLKSTIMHYFIILKYFPKIGRKLYTKNKLPIQYRKLVVDKRYILIYYVSKGNIYIDAMLDSRQNNAYYKY